jgi:Tfp pilus assembly protein PilF
VTSGGLLLAQAEALLRAGKRPEAIDAYQRLLGDEPGRPDAWFNLGWLLRQERRYDEALEAYGQALTHGVGHAEEVHVNRAAILSERLYRNSDARAELKSALSVAPRFTVAHLNLGQIEEDEGNKVDARTAYNDAIAIEPGNARAHARLGALDIFEGQSDAAIDRLANAARSTRTEDDAAEIGFALANALDANKRFDEAFACLTRANMLGRNVARTRFDPVGYDALIDGLIKAFPEATVSPRGVPSSGPEPLFVCGMFRSGSTLCEQTIARHSRVTSGGELEALPAMIGAIPDFPQRDVDYASLRDQYRRELAALFPGADIVTDKRCDNFLYIGAIKAMFPDAQIVHSVRDPLDTALSILFLHFADDISYGWRIEDIAHYWRGYRRLMTHWQRLYPDIVTFDYDAFVRAPEDEARTLFTSLGLDWEAGCDPRNAMRADVRTATTWQVRQPVHARSSGRQANYAKHIGSWPALFPA